MWCSGALVFADHVPDAAEGGPGILVDGGPHVGGGRISLAGSRLHEEHHTFAIIHQLRTHHLAVNCLVVVERIASLQIIGFGVVRLLVPLYQKWEQCHTIIYCRCADMATAPLGDAARD